MAEYHCKGADCKSCRQTGGSCGTDLFADAAPPELTEEQEIYKRALYEKMNPRRRKFVDKIGYDVWDPFQAPKDPMDIRTDRTRRTVQDLLREFMRATGGAQRDKAWQDGARECAMAIIRQDERFQGVFDFCLWYARLLELEARRSDDERTV